MTGSVKSGSPLHLAISWPAGQVFCRDQGWARSKSLLAQPAGGFATQQLTLERPPPAGIGHRCGQRSTTTERIISTPSHFGSIILYEK
jgi:hypothetical protein